ncbi:hypothetical protein O6H91_14G015300 [Diphasiastrum complanatum]|nr:hypothetical protein O6H91_14G015300 [Diphasiastrum complanatum]
MNILKIQQEKFTWKESEVRQAVSPKRHETLRRQAELRKCMDEQLKQKEDEHARIAQDQKFSSYNEHLRRYYGPHSYEEEMGRLQHKRDYLKGVMEDNIRLATLKKESEKIQKQLEVELDLIRAKTPCTWNRRHYL